MTILAEPTSAATVKVTRSALAAALRAAGTLRDAKSVFLDFDEDQALITAYTPDAAVRVALTAPCGEPAAIAVSRSALTSMLAYCGSELELRVVDDQLHVASGPTEFRLPATRPEAPDPTFGHDLLSPLKRPVKIEAAVLVEALRRALPFAAKDETRPLLCSVALYPRRHIVAATDSYRLAVVRYGDDAKTEDPVLLARAGAASMHRLLSKTLGTVEIAPGDPFVTARFDDLRWSLRQPARSPAPNAPSYPNWEQLLPEGKGDTHATIDREDLLAAARAAKVAGQRHEPLRLRFGTGGATAAIGRTSDYASMTRKLASASVEGDDVEFGVNPDFLADAAAIAPVEHLSIEIHSPLRPLLIQAARDTYLLMLIRLNV